VPGGVNFSFLASLIAQLVSNNQDPRRKAQGAATSCAIRGARGRIIGPRSPPGSSEELGWAGCGPGGPTWPLGRWVRWPVTPTGTGTGAGSCSAPRLLLRTGGCRPGAEAARVLGSQAVTAALSTGFGKGLAAILLGSTLTPGGSLSAHCNL
jgi:hypothetical protein